jgi:RNA polymerase subunit RPABC4/transcription elongation factor Spt4
MTDIIDTIKQSADQLLSGIDQKGQLRSAFEGMRTQWTELERRRKVGSLDKELKAQQSEMKQLTEALGLQTLSLYDAGKVIHPELSRLCERINELSSEVETKKATLAQLKALTEAEAEANKCPQCQANIPSGAEFCPKCGTRRVPAQISAPVAGTPAATVQQTSTVVRLRCPKCKTILSPDAGFCPTCGVKIARRPAAGSTAARASAADAQQAGTQQPVQPTPQPRAPAQPAHSGPRFCPSCGAETKPDARFCPICGQTM